jgi:hypothetical protein
VLYDFLGRNFQPYSIDDKSSLGFSTWVYIFMPAIWSLLILATGPFEIALTDKTLCPLLLFRVYRSDNTKTFGSLYFKRNSYLYARCLLLRESDEK